MINKKFLTSSLIAASLAGVVAFYACNKDDLKPADDGKNLAKELCDCFTKAGNDDAKKLTCLSDFESKANKWKDADKEAFDAAFSQAVCTPTPYQWKSAYLGKKAAQEMCACFSAADGGMMCMMGLMANYDGYFRGEDTPGDPDFENAFDAEFYNCANVPDWFICMFDPPNCPEVELTDEQN